MLFRTALIAALLSSAVLAMTVVTLPLGGSIGGDGLFYAAIHVGTPPQRFLVQLDTGSSDLLIYSTGCTDCAGKAPRYNASASKTYKILPCTAFECSKTCEAGVCQFNDTYGDGSGVNGPVNVDVLTLPTSDIRAPVTFGSIINAHPHNFEPKPTSGIWGLAYRALSSWGGVPAFQVLHHQHQRTLADSFSLCLRSDRPTASFGYAGNPSFFWTKISHDTYYGVNMTDFFVGDKSIGVPAKIYQSGFIGTIVDSGTTLFYLAETAYNQFIVALNDQCNSTNLVGVCNLTNASTAIYLDNQCWNLTADEIAAYPSVSVQIDGTLLPITASDYLFDSPQMRGCYFFGILSQPDEVGTILGDIFMQNYHVVFNRAAGKIGFAAVDTCP